MTAQIKILNYKINQLKKKIPNIFPLQQKIIAKREIEKLEKQRDELEKIETKEVYRVALP